MTYPTDLSPTETAHARERLAELAAEFAGQGSLRTQQWRAAFERTWRHPYVPAFYPDKDTPPVFCFGPTRAEWLDAVYSDTTLITKVVPVPLARELRPATGTEYASSSTLPSLVLEMLDELDVRDGHRVLEIGTGTGYNAALLCARLGSANVTSVDIDAELVDLARERLAANGHTPTLAAVDGHLGHPPGAPYDRIIATCSVPLIPVAWLQQAAPGAIILADVHGPLGGTLARLTVDERGQATGRFLPHWAGFMPMRSPEGPRAYVRYDYPARESRTAIDPMTIMNHGPFGFVAQWHLPEVALGLGGTEIHLTATDGSRAEITTTPDRAGYRVREYGNRDLWQQVERAHAFWQAEGRPSYERFGVTATPTHQHVWYDHPAGRHRWPLFPSR